MIDSVRLLSSTPKISIFHAVLQMLRCGQHCTFCHIESCVKNDVKSLIKLQSTLFFVHIEPVHIVFISVC